MENITIVINWAYFLGILGSLIGIAWYTSGRFTALETSVQWLIDVVRDLRDSAKKRKRRLKRS